MKINELKDKKVLILGFGREGRVTLKFLKDKMDWDKAAVADQRPFDKMNPEEKEMLKGIKTYLGADYLDSLVDYDIIIKSPGINSRLPKIKEAVEKGLIVTTATNIFLSECKGKVIAVTGSKGKSTTSSMIFHVLKNSGKSAELVGNIGNPALDFLANDSSDKIYIFEISSYQTEDLGNEKIGIDIAVLVSFFPEHLDYHGSVDEYFTAKMNLIGPGRTKSDPLTVVYNAGNERIKTFCETACREKPALYRCYGFNDGIRSRIENDAAWVEGEKIASLLDLKLIGKHNLQNVLAVFEVCNLMGIQTDEISKHLKSFKPLEHRLEPVGVFKGITFYNDSISTAPESTIAALEAVSASHKVATLICGGLDRGYDYSDLASKIVELKIQNLILLPETGKKIQKAVLELIDNDTVAFVECNDMQYCVEEVFKRTAPGKVCLLSCASPSYNLFRDFTDRGLQYKNMIRDLSQK